MPKTIKKTAGWLNWKWEILITVGYVVSHFFQLLALPVFADESIYIRWSQLIIDDWQRYAFFALNDGKTPLFIWSLIPLQFLFHDQLLASRVVAVLVGLIQVLVVKIILVQLKASKRAQLFGMLFTTILPFWFTYHRLALMDGMMTLFISLTFLGILKIIANVEQQPSARKQVVVWTVLTGLFWGLALWTKLPALFFGPVFVLAPLFLVTNSKKQFTQILHSFIPLGLAGAVGLVIFFSLKLTPAFGQLFGRSKDFSYSFKQVFFEGKLAETIPRWNYYLSILLSYVTAPALIIGLIGIFITTVRRRSLLLLGATAAMATPFWLLGKVVYPRYLLPAALFLTLVAALNLDQIITQFVEQQTNIGRKIVVAVVVALATAGIITPSLMFAGYSLFDINHIPFMAIDQEQYLKEWSAGQGIVETVTYIKDQAKTHSIAVATEGSFGTLPDGILLYFHRQKVDNLYIEGIGQPVVSIPEFFKERASKFDQIILIVNSHRMKLKLDPSQKIAEYCRPDSSPCLQLWDITSLVKEPNTNKQ